MIAIKYSKWTVKNTLLNLLDEYLYKNLKLNYDFFKLYYKLSPKSRYEKLMNDGELPYQSLNTIDKYNIDNILLLFSRQDKIKFIDWYFRYCKGNYYTDKVQHTLFEALRSADVISYKFVNNISETHNINKIYIKNYIKKILKKTIITRAQMNKIEKMKSFVQKLNTLKKEGFKFIDSAHKYLINEKGVVYKAVKSNQGINIVKPLDRWNNKGMRYYIVSINSKHEYLHRLVAKYFVDNFNGYKYVRAFDRNFQNVDYKNLEWVKYPAITRVLDSFSDSNKSWLSFIIKNFEGGINLTILSLILSELASEKNIFPNNHNKSSTIYATINKYSQTNNLFPIFTIMKEHGHIVMLNTKVYNKFIERGEHE